MRGSPGAPPPLASLSRGSDSLGQSRLASSIAVRSRDQDSSPPKAALEDLVARHSPPQLRAALGDPAVKRSPRQAHSQVQHKSGRSLEQPTRQMSTFKPTSFQKEATSSDLEGHLHKYSESKDNVRQFIIVCSNKKLLTILLKNTESNKIWNDEASFKLAQNIYNTNFCFAPISVKVSNVSCIPS